MHEHIICDWPRSGKTGLIAYDSIYIFHQEHKATLINYQIAPSKSAKLEWSAFASCFSQAQW